MPHVPHAPTTTATVLSVLLLVSCAGPDAGPTPPPPVPETTTATSPPVEAATQAPSPDPAPGMTPEPVEVLTAVDCPGPERELSALEAALLVEPARFSGEAFDAAAVVETVAARHPVDVAAWAAHIRSQIQADYAATVCETINFSAEIGAGQPQPEGTAAVPGEAPVGQNHFALVLDASGSMAAASGNGTRMSEAKAALDSFVEELPEGATVSVRVYGHEGSNSDADRVASCASSELLYQGAADAPAMTAGIAGVEPVGWTPLARAISESAADIPGATSDAIVYVVTDGIETCDGDPVAAAQELSATGVEPIVNVIGFKTGDADHGALRAIAEAGGGDFTPVGSGTELEDYWQEEHRRMARAWMQWRNEELGRIRAEGTENTRRARNLSRTLGDLAVAQHEHAELTLEQMRSEETLPKRDLNALHWLLEDQRNEVTNYAFDTGNANQGAALAASANSWNEVYDAGGKRWLEHYEKAQGEG